MRVVLVDAPESLLDERRRLGMVKFDERWEGEWHFVIPPKLRIDWEGGSAEL